MIFYDTLSPNLTYIEGIYLYINHLDIIYDMTPTRQKVSSVRVLSLHECFFLFASSIYGLHDYLVVASAFLSVYINPTSFNKMNFFLY